MDSLTEPIIQLPAALALMAWTAVGVLQLIRYLKALLATSPNPGANTTGEWRGRMESVLDNVARQIERHRDVEQGLTTVMADVKHALTDVCDHLEENSELVKHGLTQIDEIHRVVTKEPGKALGP